MGKIVVEHSMDVWRSGKLRDEEEVQGGTGARWWPGRYRTFLAGPHR